MIRNLFFSSRGIIVIPLFFLFSCTSGKPDLNYAIALRALDAARSMGANYSRCSSKYYFEAQRNLKLGERFMLEEKNWEKAEENLIKAKELAEKAEEGVIFCED